ncbi:hypothetical protein PtB15_4B32 [Puccinia triticina]|nr:hypothetical protein PtB15_4B32 [Puccinia triticina]
MPPKRRRQIPRIIPPSPSDPQPTLHQTLAPRQTRSGKTFGAPGESSIRSRRRHPRHLTPGSPPHSPPRAARKRKSRAVLEDSDSEESTNDQTYEPRITRPRRGSAPKELTVIDGQAHQQTTNEATGIEGTRQPRRTINFPWGFSIPLPELSQTDRHLSLFAPVEEEKMRFVLREIGCSVVGKTRPQLVNLCIRFAQLIESLPSNSSQSALPNASPTPVTTLSNSTNIPSNGATQQSHDNLKPPSPRPSRSPLGNTPQTPDATHSNPTNIPSNGGPQQLNSNNLNVPSLRPSWSPLGQAPSRSPLGNAPSCSPLRNTPSRSPPGNAAQTPEATNSNPAQVQGADPTSIVEDLIQWNTPPNARKTPPWRNIPNRRNLPPDSPNTPPNPRHQPMYIGSPGPSSVPVICHAGDPASLPGLNTDLPKNHDGDHAEASSNHSDGALHTMQDNQIAIIELLQTHSKKFSDLQDDIAITLRNQQEIKEKLESLSGVILHQNVRPGRPARANPMESNVPAPQAFPRTARLKQLLKLHFESLFGLPAGADLPPSPPTTSEKAKWRVHIDDDSPDDAEMECDGNNPESDKEASDPQFPYRGGPGHPWASQEQLKIMHRMLREKGMERFRMDLTLRLDDPENKFCLSVARDIFVQLVECGEYEGLQPHECEADFILQQLTEYVRDKFARKVRESAKFPMAVQLLRAKEKSRSTQKLTVRNNRMKSALEIGGLQPLFPIIKACTSDDETDDEITPAPVACGSSSRRKKEVKYCKARQLVWRSKEVTQAFVLLDEYRKKKISSTCKARRGIPARLRRRPPCPKISTIKPAQALAKDAYDKDWLEAQNQIIVDELNVVSQPVMKKILSRLQSLA